MTDRILVVRIDKIGDTVLSTPFLHNLRVNYPRAEIVALTSAYNREVLAHHPDVDLVVEEVSGSFDIAIALSPTVPTYRIVADTRAPIRLGLVYASRWPVRLMSRWWLTRTTVVDVEGALSRGEEVPHEVRQMLSILSDSGLTVEECPLSLYPTAVQRQEAERLLPSSRVLGIHLSVRWFTDGWEIGDFMGVLDQLRAAFPDDTWLVTHGPAEREYAPAVGERAEVVLAGAGEFGVWAALIGRCRAYVTTDTGALHVASALQVPVVAVYEGATYEHCSQQWAPWMVAHEKIRKAQSASTAEAVVRALHLLLKEV